MTTIHPAQSPYTHFSSGSTPADDIQLVLMILITRNLCASYLLRYNFLDKIFEVAT